jgi:hypothetical protein
LFGDVSVAALGEAKNRFIALSLHHWATRHTVCEAATTHLLKLFHGGFGRHIGIRRELLKRLGEIPQTAHTLFEHAANVTDELDLLLLTFKDIQLPDDNGLRGASRTCRVWYSPDLRKNLVLKLLDPHLNSNEYPFIWQRRPVLPEPFECASTVYGPPELQAREAAHVSAEATLEADIAAQIPGTPKDKVLIVCYGVSLFIDSIGAHKNQSNPVNTFLVGITSLNPATINSPHASALAGLWILPGVLRQTHVSGEEVSVAPSKFTLTNLAILTEKVHHVVVADPTHKLLTSGSLIVRIHDVPLPAAVKAKVRAAEPGNAGPYRQPG